MSEIRVGMAVRDATGKQLGKIRRVYPWGFAVVRGFWQPHEWLFRHSEVTGIDGDVVQISRSPDDLQRLAAGGLPAGWSGKAPPFGERAIPAAPGEARNAAAGLQARAPGADRPPPAPPDHPHR